MRSLFETDWKPIRSHFIAISKPMVLGVFCIVFSGLEGDGLGLFGLFWILAGEGVGVWVGGFMVF